MKKSLYAAVLLAALVPFLSFAGGNKESKSSSKEVNIRVGMPKAPPALPVLRMIETNALGNKAKISFTVWDAPENLIAMVQGNEFEMFAFPLTVIAKLYNKGLPVTLTNVNTWGVTYFLTTDSDFKDWSQLKDKTVYIPLQSSPLDVITQFFMNKAGLDPKKDVNIVYVSQMEVTQLLASGKAQYATSIEPQVTAAIMKNPDVRVAYAFENEWKKYTSDSTIIPNAGFGVKNQFLKGNAKLVKEFEAEYEKALNWVVANPKEAAALAEKYLGLKTALVEKAIPNMGLMYKNAFKAKADLNQFWQLLLDFDKTTIGGKVPDENILYKK